MSLGLGLGIGYTIVRGGAAVFDPATLDLGLWVRGSFAASPWVGTASEGDSGSRDFSEATNPPSAGSLLNGYAPATFDGTNDQLVNGTDAASIFTTTSGSLACLFNVTNAAAPTGNWYDDDGLYGEAGIDINLTFSTSGVTGVVRDGSGRQRVTIVCTTAAWHLVILRWDGVNMGLTLDSAAEQTTPCGTLPFLSGASAIGTYSGGLGADPPPRGFLDGSIMELMASSESWDQDTRDGILDYVNSRYGLAL